MCWGDLVDFVAWEKTGEKKGRMTSRRQQRNNLARDTAVIEKEKACNIHRGLPAGSLMHSTSGLFSFACLKFHCICDGVKSRLGTGAALSLLLLFSTFHQRQPETLSVLFKTKECQLLIKWGGRLLVLLLNAAWTVLWRWVSEAFTYGCIIFHQPW